MDLFSGGIIGTLLGIGKKKPKPAPVRRLVDEDDVSEATREQDFLKKQKAKKSLSSLGLFGGPLGDSAPPRTSRATLV
jgi:hypothetical protein